MILYPFLNVLVHGLLHEYMEQIARKCVIFDGISMGELTPTHSSTVETVLCARGTPKGPRSAPRASI